MNMIAAYEIEVKALDECVDVRMRNENGMAYMTLEVSEAEKLIDLLKESIEEAKKSKWYSEK